MEQHRLTCPHHQHDEIDHDRLPSYKMVSGLPSYKEAMKQLRKQNGEEEVRRFPYRYFRVGWFAPKRKVPLPSMTFVNSDNHSPITTITTPNDDTHQDTDDIASNPITNTSQPRTPSVDEIIPYVVYENEVAAANRNRTKALVDSSSTKVTPSNKRSTSSEVCSVPTTPATPASTPCTIEITPDVVTMS